MWTFDQPPSATLSAEKYGFSPTPEWLQALRLSAVRVGGASGAFVSRDGLVLTNHHVAMSCIQGLSSEARDFVATGFLAASRAERPCPGMELRRLESTEDVTAKVRAAITAKDDAAVNGERNAVIAAIEDDCKEKTALRCEVVNLYRGAAYSLHRYRVWTDVRLAFAPEAQIDLGGDDDNFVYPRFDLDAVLLRVYDKGDPVHPEHFLKWSKTGVKDGDLVLAAGHPYSTDRLLTVTQVVFDRDVRFPVMIASAKRARKVCRIWRPVARGHAPRRRQPLRHRELVEGDAGRVEIAAGPGIARRQAQQRGAPAQVVRACEGSGRSLARDRRRDAEGPRHSHRALGRRLRLRHTLRQGGQDRRAGRRIDAARQRTPACVPRVGHSPSHAAAHR